MRGRHLALLVATDVYADGGFQQLRAPGADVEALRSVLADQEIGGYTVSVLVNEPSYKVNEAIDGFFAEAGLEDLVLLYFSGHGYRDDTGQLHLITRDSRHRRLASTAISSRFIRDQLDHSRSRRKIVMLDCCYAGAFPGSSVPRAPETVDILATLGGRGSAVITASSELEYAFEAKGLASSSVTEVPIPAVFTGALVDGLATGSADLDGDGLVAIDELYEHIYKTVKKLVPQQTPGCSIEVEGSLYVAKNPNGPRPTQLPEEIHEAVRSPLPAVRLAVIDHLIAYCTEAHPGRVLTARAVLTRLAGDDSRQVATAANAALQRIDGGAAEKISRCLSVWNPASLMAAADRDIVSKRTAAEQEIAQMRTSTIRERDEIIAAAKLRADEIQNRAQRILQESEERRAQAIKFRTEAEQEARLFVSNARQQARRILAQARAQAGQSIAAKGSAKGPQATVGGSGILRRLIKGSPEPESAPVPEVEEVKLVRQQRVRQSRSKRSGKR